MRLAYVTNLPAPYRVAFLNELGRYCELTVFYERQSASDRDANWRAEKPESYHEVYCSDRPIGADQSLGFDLMRRVRKAKFDRLLISGYSSPAVMALILDCQRRRIPYYMQYDGGFPAAGGLRQTLKKRLLQPAAGHFTSSDVHAEYLRSLGIRPERIWKYPFTSLTEEDILATPISDINRAAIRRELGVTEARIVLAVGRFIPCKGFDVLLQAAHLMQEPDLGFYLVGGEATLEYAELCRRLRQAFPGCAITTDIMVGFPGETEQDHLESCEFVMSIGFAEAHIFPYSRRPDTPADSLPCQLNGDIKAQRAAEMAEICSRSQSEYLSENLGTVKKVLFERESSPEYHQGHTDNYILVKVPRTNIPTLRGRMMPAKLCQLSDNCIIGELCDDTLINKI